MADPYRYFRIEAREILEQLQTELLALEKGAPVNQVIPTLLRLAHTLKGAARVVKQNAIADHSHALEDLLVPIRDDGAAVSASVLQSSLQHVDAMRAGLQALSTPAVISEPTPNSAALPAIEEPFWATGSNKEDLGALMDGIAELNVQVGGVRGSRNHLARAAGLAELLGDQLSAGSTPQLSEAESSQARALVQELQSAMVEADSALSTSIEQVARELGQVREAAERLRLVPADSLWGALERTARDAALSLGKTVTFHGHGGNVRLESDLLSQVQRALMQAVRNAVAHGVENPAERQAAAKSPTGVVSVHVTRRDRNFVFSCTDDGRGLDLEAIRQRAQDRGLAPESLVGLDADGLARLLLQGGISTARTVTSVAGRGIGLDLIREVAAKLGGSVTLESGAGRGATISLIVPVSLSALPALLVQVGGQVVALPLTSVRGTIQRVSEQIAHTAGGDTVLLDGKVIPYASLDRLLAMEVVDGRMRAARSAVVVQADQVSAALGVERLLSIETVIVRSLPELALLSSVVSGASFDAEGNPQLVLSPEGLVRSARQIGAAPRAAAPRRAPILVIDDSLTTRMLEQSILESAGYEVDLAVSGEEGMEKARQRSYALFLVDVEMPGMDGFAFIERTRNDPQLRGVPAILVTSRASPQDLQRGRAVGALAHIEKREFSQTDLLELIRKLMA